MRLLGVSLAIVLAGLTYTDGARWRSNRSLWCGALSLAPDKPRALNNCALEHIRAGDYAAALPLLQHALVTLETREPNRRAALRNTVLANQVLALYALRQTDAMRVAMRAMDPTDPRAQWYQTWIAD